MNKLHITAVATAVAGIPLLGAVGPAASPTLSTESLAKNGGCERWLDGNLAPVSWLPSGTERLDAQTAIQFARVPEDKACATGGGDAMSVTSATDSDYVYQHVPDGDTLAGTWVTAALELRSTVGALQPVVEIDDGAGPPTQLSVTVSGGGWLSFRVEHRLDPCAEHLELRIYPRGGPLDVDDVVLAVGKGVRPLYGPRDVDGLPPIGSFLDWWPGFPGAKEIPDGYVVADGGLVTDAHSPLRGIEVPNLVDRFVKGGTLANVLSEGGQATLHLSHNHGGSTGDCKSNGFDFWIQFGGWGRPALEFHAHSISSDLGTYDNAPPYTTLVRLVRIR